MATTMCKVCGPVLGSQDEHVKTVAHCENYLKLQLDIGFPRFDAGFDDVVFGMHMEESPGQTPKRKRERHMFRVYLVKAGRCQMCNHEEKTFAAWKEHLTSMQHARHYVRVSTIIDIPTFRQKFGCLTVPPPELIRQAQQELITSPLETSTPTRDTSANTPRTEPRSGVGTQIPGIQQTLATNATEKVENVKGKGENLREREEIVTERVKIVSGKVENVKQKVSERDENVMDKVKNRTENKWTEIIGNVKEKEENVKCIKGKDQSLTEGVMENLKKVCGKVENVDRKDKFRTEKDENVINELKYGSECMKELVEEKKLTEKVGIVEEKVAHVKGKGDNVKEKAINVLQNVDTSAKLKGETLVNVGQVQSPSKVINSGSKINKSPSKVIKSPSKVVKSPSKVINSASNVVKSLIVKIPKSVLTSQPQLAELRKLSPGEDVETKPTNSDSSYRKKVKKRKMSLLGERREFSSADEVEVSGAKKARVGEVECIKVVAPAQKVVASSPTVGDCRKKVLMENVRRNDVETVAGKDVNLKAGVDDGSRNIATESGGSSGAALVGDNEKQQRQVQIGEKRKEQLSKAQAMLNKLQEQMKQIHMRKVVEKQAIKANTEKLSQLKQRELELHELEGTIDLLNKKKQAQKNAADEKIRSSTLIDTKQVFRKQLCMLEERMMKCLEKPTTRLRGEDIQLLQRARDYVGDYVQTEGTMARRVGVGGKADSEDKTMQQAQQVLSLAQHLRDRLSQHFREQSWRAQHRLHPALQEFKTGCGGGGGTTCLAAEATVSATSTAVSAAGGDDRDVARDVSIQLAQCRQQAEEAAAAAAASRAGVVVDDELKQQIVALISKMVAAAGGGSVLQQQDFTVLVRAREIAMHKEASPLDETVRKAQHLVMLAENLQNQSSLNPEEAKKLSEALSRSMKSDTQPQSHNDTATAKHDHQTVLHQHENELISKQTTEPHVLTDQQTATAAAVPMETMDFPVAMVQENAVTSSRVTPREFMDTIQDVEMKDVSVVTEGITTVTEDASSVNVVFTAKTEGVSLVNGSVAPDNQQPVGFAGHRSEERKTVEKLLKQRRRNVRRNKQKKQKKALDKLNISRSANNTSLIEKVTAIETVSPKKAAISTTVKDTVNSDQTRLTKNKRRSLRYKQKKRQKQEEKRQQQKQKQKRLEEEKLQQEEKKGQHQEEEILQQEKKKGQHQEEEILQQEKKKGQQQKHKQQQQQQQQQQQEEQQQRKEQWSNAPTDGPLCAALTSLSHASATAITGTTYHTENLGQGGGGERSSSTAAVTGSSATGTATTGPATTGTTTTGAIIRGTKVTETTTVIGTATTGPVTTVTATKSTISEKVTATATVAPKKVAISTIVKNTVNSGIKSTVPGCSNLISVLETRPGTTVIGTGAAVTGIATTGPVTTGTATKSTISEKVTATATVAPKKVAISTSVKNTVNSGMKNTVPGRSNLISVPMHVDVQTESVHCTPTLAPIKPALAKSNLISVPLTQQETKIADTATKKDNIEDNNNNTKELSENCIDEEPANKASVTVDPDVDTDVRRVFVVSSDPPLFTPVSRSLRVVVTSDSEASDKSSPGKKKLSPIRCPRPFDLRNVLTPNKTKSRRPSSDMSNDECENFLITVDNKKTSVSTPDKAKSLVSTSEKTKSLVSTPDKVKSSISTSDKTKSSVSTSDKVKSPVSTINKTKSSDSTSDKTKNSDSTSDKVKSPVSTFNKTKSSVSKPTSTKRPNATTFKAKKSVSSPPKAKSSETVTHNRAKKSKWGSPIGKNTVPHHNQKLATASKVPAVSTNKQTGTKIGNNQPVHKTANQLASQTNKPAQHWKQTVGGPASTRISQPFPQEIPAVVPDCNPLNMAVVGLVAHQLQKNLSYCRVCDVSLPSDFAIAQHYCLDFDTGNANDISRHGINCLTQAMRLGLTGFLRTYGNVFINIVSSRLVGTEPPVDEVEPLISRQRGYITYVWRVAAVTQLNCHLCGELVINGWRNHVFGAKHLLKYLLACRSYNLEAMVVYFGIFVIPSWELLLNNKDAILRLYHSSVVPPFSNSLEIPYTPWHHPPNRPEDSLGRCILY